MKNPWIAIGVLVVVLIGGSIAYSQYASQSYNEGVEVVDVHVKGNPDAEVTLAKYSDFSCPACGQAYPFAKELVDLYGDQLRFEYKHFAFLQLGEPAALAAEAAGQQGMFFEYHDALFDNQNEWLNSNLPQRHFTQYAEELGLDMDLWEQHRRSSLLREDIRADRQEGLALGVTGTPTFFLNGERMTFSSFDSFITQVEDALGIPEGERLLDMLNAEPMEIELGELGDLEEEVGADGELNVEFGL